VSAAALFDAGAPPPCPAPFNMAAQVLALAGAQPDKVALAVVTPARAERWSYARLEAAVRGTATGLLARGLVPGDRVLMRLGNTPDFPVVYLGALAAGLVPVVTSAQLTRGEITGIAAALAPRLVVAGPEVPLPEAPDLPVLEGAALAALRDLPPAAYHMGDPERPGYIVLTSGTSGRPRPVEHAHRAIWARRLMWDGWYGLRPDDRLMHAGALNWTYTLGTGLMDPWSLGATALIPGPGVAPAQLPLLVKRHDATILAAAPGVFRQMLRAPVPALPKLRHGLSAGEKLPEPLRAAWRAATGTDLHEAFGMSECSTFVSGAPDRPAPAGTIGSPQPGRRVAVVDAEGRPVARGAAGTLAVSRRDPGLMLGYLGDGREDGDGAEAELARRMRGEWFLTGDSAVMEPGGALRYLGRGDDMMNAGGYRVSPLEVEAALAAHPGIEDCAAVELRVKADTTVIGAFYTGPEALEEAALAAFAAGALARYKQPRIFVHVAALPRGANGKLRRRALRAGWEAAHPPAP
jgi:acyl-coenzyme A synthetase/AMP-(fatty) acid ligase